MNQSNKTGSPGYSDKSHQNHQKRILNAAKKLHAQGIAVVALNGKIPAQQWADSKPPLKNVLRRIEFNPNSNLGHILKYPVNGLQWFVLDFDTLDGFEKFSEHAPHLLKTKIVTTRQGKHIYFSNPHHFRQRNYTKLNPHPVFGKMDFISNGQVAAPPSLTSEGREYQDNGLPVYQLTDADIEFLKPFFGMHQYSEEEIKTKTRTRTQKYLPEKGEPETKPAGVSSRMWAILTSGEYRKNKLQFKLRYIFDMCFVQHLAALGYDVDQVIEIYRNNAHESSRFWERGANYIESTYLRAISYKYFKTMLGLRYSVIHSNLPDSKKKCLLAVLNVCAMANRTDAVRISKRRMVEMTGLNVQKAMKWLRTTGIITKPNVKRQFLVNHLQIRAAIESVQVTDTVAAIAEVKNYSDAMASDKHKAKHQAERERYKIGLKNYHAEEKEKTIKVAS